LASSPVIASILCAALPVGAASPMSLPIACQSATIVQIAELVAKVERLLHLAKQTDDPDYLAGFISGRFPLSKDS